MNDTGMEDKLLRLASILMRDMHSVSVRWQKVLAQAVWVAALPSISASIGNAAEQYCRMPGSR